VTLAVGLASVFADVTSVTTNPIMAMGEGTDAPYALALTVAVLVIGAPLLEELLFRGVILPWLATFMTPWRAVAISAVLFGAVHIPSHGLHFLVATAYGAALGWTRVRTRSLLPCMLVHAAINAAASIQLLL